VTSTSETAAASGQAKPELLSRKSSGLVREVRFIDQAAFNAVSAPAQAIIIFGLFGLVLFPGSNIYIVGVVAPVLGFFVWATFALLTAALPRLGGDYTFNSRILTPTLGLIGNVAEAVSATLGAGLWAYFFSTQALSPAFSVIGAVTHSHTLLDWGSSFSPAHKTVCFIVAAAALALTSVLAARGTKVVTRAMTVLFFIAVFGLLVSTLALLFTSHASFVSHVNAVGGSGSYAHTAAQAPKAPGSFKANLGGLYEYMTNFIWIFWGCYLASEFRGAGRRRRQLGAMVGTGLVQSVLVFLVIVIFLNTAGHAFFVSAMAGNFAPAAGLISTANFVYFSALVSGSTFLVVLISLTFIGWWLPGQYINQAMVQRALLTWSLDGLLPKRVSRVSARTHTPLVAIGITFLLTVGTAALAAYYAKFSQIFLYIILFGYLPIVLVGISATVMRWRRGDLYFNSAAEWRVGGVEALPILGVGCACVGALLIGLALYFHATLGIPHLYTPLLWLAGLVVACGVWMAVARAVRAREGVDLALVYREIPPD
jgi:APA family basic amino acid/polyamine antiporter